MENPNSTFFGIFHGQHFESVEYGAMISHIFTDNTIIGHNNIYNVLKHVCVVPQHAFRGKYYKLS